MADRDRRHQQGRAHPGRGEGRADAQARQEAADAAAAGAARARARRPRRASRSSSPADGSELVYTFDAAERATPASPACCARLAELGIDFKDLQTQQSSLEDIFVEPRERAAMNVHADPRHLPLRDGAHLPHAGAEHRLAGALDLALLRRLRLGDRLAHGARSTASATAPSSCPGLIMLSLLTESISNASFGIYMPQVLRHDLRGAVGAGLGARDRARLRRRRGHQVGHPRARSSSPPRALFVPLRDRASRCGWLAFLVLTAVTFSLFGFIIGIWADGFEKLQIVPHADRHAADLPRRQLLLDQHAAAALAEDHAVQPGGLPDQRLPLELLRHLRRERRRQPRHDARVPAAVPAPSSGGSSGPATG